MSVDSAALPSERVADARRPGVLEVLVLTPADAERAQFGGADRVHVCALVDGEERSVEPAALSAIVKSVDIPVTVTLRLSAGLSTQGGELARLTGLASSYRSLGAARFSFGFLTRDLEVDLGVCEALAEATDGTSWVFDRTFDHALDSRKAWQAIVPMPGLVGVRTGGAILGMAAGLDDLLGLARVSEEVASLAIASGGVEAEHVPWLARSGITRLHLGASVRPGKSWSRARVDAGFVRSWRLLLDDACRVAAMRG